MSMKFVTAASVCSLGECVAVAQADDSVYLRDSKQADGPILKFTMGEWETFVDAVQAGEFNYRREMPTPPSVVAP